MSKTTRVSPKQRQKLLEYMQAHEDLARGRVAGADASRRKSAMLGELATLLNAMGGGATKTPEKWFKSWQDWRSDTKAKALKIKKYREGTGPSPPPLSQMEETLLTFCGIEMVEGVQDVADPLHIDTDTVEAEAGNSEQCKEEVIEEEVADDSSTTRQESRRETKNNRVSPVSRPANDRPRLRHRPSTNRAGRTRIDPDWVMELERRRVDSEKKIADAALIMAESTRVQAEASRVQAETSRVQAEASRVQAEASRVQAEAMRVLAETVRDQCESMRAHTNAIIDLVRELRSGPHTPK